MDISHGNITIPEEIYNQVVNLAFERKPVEAVRVLHDYGKIDKDGPSSGNNYKWGLKECKAFIDVIIKNFSDI